MKNKNFTTYKPEHDNPHSIAYLKDEDGNDWYELQKHFLKDTLKIAYDNNGIIKSLSYDVSMMFPAMLSVAEINVDDVPEGVSIDGCWEYKKGRVTMIPVDYADLACTEKAKLLYEASLIISTLQDAVDFGMATEEENRLLIEWKKYRVCLSRIVTEDGKTIEWPEKPL